ncbi:MAG: hypothetical protein ACI8ZB_001995 [Desulforhopalus sp.]|jgi:hypothetical protein
MSDRRIPFTIPVKPWFCDHSFAGTIVLPAVETMLLLAAKVAELHPEVDVRVMENVRFAKFLEIPPVTATMIGLVECEVVTDGRVQVKLLSRTQCKAMSRIKEHGAVDFSPASGHSQPPPSIDLAPPMGPVTEITVEYLYRELVPFGPHYQTLQETLYLSGDKAWGRLKAPALSADPVQAIIGSPFPLDGALHAACVLGQQAVGFIPFPVGFDRRIITRPTQPGCYYQTRVQQVMQTDDALVFDLVIAGEDGQVYETVTGVRMRDVSGAMKK